MDVSKFHNKKIKLSNGKEVFLKFDINNDDYKKLMVEIEKQRQILKNKFGSTDDESMRFLGIISVDDLRLLEKIDPTLFTNTGNPDNDRKKARDFFRTFRSLSAPDVI